MANVIVKLQQKGRDEINRFWKLGIILATVAVPTLLIIKQPDYGTALAFLVALIFMLYVAGINQKIYYNSCTISSYFGTISIFLYITRAC